MFRENLGMTLFMWFKCHASIVGFKRWRRLLYHTSNMIHASISVRSLHFQRYPALNFSSNNRFECGSNLWCSSRLQNRWNVWWSKFEMDSRCSIKRIANCCVSSSVSSNERGTSSFLTFVDNIYFYYLSMLNFSNF